MIFPIPRVACRACGVVRQVEVPFADPRRTYTKAFERYALELSRCMTILDVARHLGVSWDVIKDIQKRDLSRRYAKPKLKDLRRIAIDEIAVAKGHRYLTVVLDLESGAVVFVGDGKGGDALKPFWKRLRRCKAKIEAVAMDMSPAYHDAVATHLPKATIVYDHFHVIKLFNDKLSDLRRSLYHQGRRRAEEGPQGVAVAAAEGRREPRPRARRGGPVGGGLEAEQAAGDGLLPEGGPAGSSGTSPARGSPGRSSRTGSGVRRPRACGCSSRWPGRWRAIAPGLLAYYDYPISTGPLEGTNNKIKTMKRQAYGFRDQEFFKLKILAIHEAKYALVG